MRSNHTPLNNRLLRSRLGCYWRMLRRRWRRSCRRLRNCCRGRSRRRLCRWRYDDCRRRRRFFRNRNWQCRGFLHRRRNHHCLLCGDNRSYRSFRRNHRWLFRWRRSYWWLDWNFRRNCRRRRGCCNRTRCRTVLLFFALSEQAGNVARLGYLGEVNFWPDFSGSRTLARRGRAGFGRKVSTNFLRFVIFNRRRMGLLVCYAQVSQNVQNRFCFDFELFSQFVDSHPLCVSSQLSPKQSYSPRASCRLIFLNPMISSLPDLVLQYPHPARVALPPGSHLARVAQPPGSPTRDALPRGGVEVPPPVSLQ